MVAGLKFLSKKAFNPQNLSNQKRVWEKEQKQSDNASKAVQRERQLRRERDDEELAKARGDPVRLSFIYEQPPGLEQKQQDSANANAAAAEDAVTSATIPITGTTSSSSGGTSMVDLTERQPGDDVAAAAFRQFLAGTTTARSQTAATTTSFSQTPFADGKFIMQGTTFDPIAAKMNERNDNSNKTGSASNSLTALEKAVGRKQNFNGKNTGGLSLDQQIQRFPALANAPRAPGMKAKDGTQCGGGSLGVTFKPLGTQIRNVRCLACGIWGHSRGDRECDKTGWNPFAATTNTTAGDSNINATSLEATSFAGMSTSRILAADTACGDETATARYESVANIEEKKHDRGNENGHYKKDHEKSKKRSKKSSKSYRKSRSRHEDEYSCSSSSSSQSTRSSQNDDKLSCKRKSSRSRTRHEEERSRRRDAEPRRRKKHDKYENKSDEKHSSTRKHRKSHKRRKHER